MSHEELLAEYERLKEQTAQMQALAAQLQAENSQLREQLKEAQLLIAHLRRELFGPKADKLTPEQEKQLQALNKDLQDEAQRPGPVSDLVLERVGSTLRYVHFHRFSEEYKKVAAAAEVGRGAEPPQVRSAGPALQGSPRRSRRGAGPRRPESTRWPSRRRSRGRSRRSSRRCPTSRSCARAPPRTSARCRWSSPGASSST